MIQRRWWWCPERRIGFLVVFFSSSFASSSLLIPEPTLALRHVTFTRPFLSCISSFNRFSFCRGKAKRLHFFYRVLSGFACCSASQTHLHISQQTDDRIIFLLPIVMRSSPRRPDSILKSVIFIIFAVQIYVTTRAYNATRVHIFLIWYFLSSLGNRRENIRSMMKIVSFTDDDFVSQCFKSFRRRCSNRVLSNYFRTRNEIYPNLI